MGTITTLYELNATCPECSGMLWYVHPDNPDINNSISFECAECSHRTDLYSLVPQSETDLASCMEEYEKEISSNLDEDFNE